ncbi:MAG: RidA family protein [Deltaproteobacteria bacterium]|nr:RidA family protein [Deltaproteobacteria bacterium]
MKERIQPGSIARPVGPYCHAIKVAPKQLVFVAGQIPIDKDGNIVGVDYNDRIRNLQTIDLAAQVRQTMVNLKDALEAAGASLKDLIRLDTYVVASAMNEYKTIGMKAKHDVLAGVQVPGATVFVAGLMPPDALVEISGIAAMDE